MSDVTDSCPSRHIGPSPAQRDRMREEPRGYVGGFGGLSFDLGVREPLGLGEEPVGHEPGALDVRRHLRKVAELEPGDQAVTVVAQRRKPPDQWQPGARERGERRERAMRLAEELDLLLEVMGQRRSDRATAVRIEHRRIAEIDRGLSISPVGAEESERAVVAAIVEKGRHGPAFALIRG